MLNWHQRGLKRLDIDPERVQMKWVMDFSRTITSEYNDRPWRENGWF